MIGPRLRASWSAVRGREREVNRDPIRRVSPVGYPRPVPVATPPVPPPLPGGRIRVAELATSMLWAAPLTALLSLPAAGMLGIEPAAEPQQLAYLIVMALLGIWGFLVANKAFEGRTLDPTTRRMLSLGIGLLLGAASLLFDGAFRVGPPSDTPQRILIGTGLAPWLDIRNWPGAATESLLYFGGLFLVGNWWKLASRDRKARFRIWPILVASLIGSLLLPFSPTAQPYGIAVAALIASVTQLVSPWNERAAAYARATRSRRWWPA
jgi:hypothetical protein